VDASAKEDLFQRDVAEVHLLLDFISGRTDRSLAGLKDLCEFDCTGAKVDRISPQRVIEEICKITYAPDDSLKPNAQHAAFMLVVKDKLTELAAPARGLTIAFTSMFAGVSTEPKDVFGRRLESGRRHSPKLQVAVGRGEERFYAARAAYPNLEWHARRFRSYYARLPILALLLVALIAFINWDMSVTGTVVQQISQADADFKSLFAVDKSFIPSDERCFSLYRPGATVTAPGGTSSAAPPRAGASASRRGHRARRGPATLAPIGVGASAANEQQRQICKQAHEVVGRQIAGRRNLQALLGAGYTHPVALGVLWFAPGIAQMAGAGGGGQSGSAFVPLGPGNPALARPTQLESLTIAVMAGLNNIVIPTLFGLLGTMVGVLRSITSKMRDATLAPRDAKVASVAMFLGMAAGLTVGLLLSPADSAGALGKGLGGAISVSAASLSFLAGVGAEAFFAFLDGIIANVFAAAPAGRTQPPK
jgi:hypothetical protein